tara:strand:- start:478 stop:723 length:246 start_codon:yes stop_codon:yes gene_type:complete
MGIALTTEEVIHIADLLRDDVLMNRMVLETNPLDVNAMNSITTSKSIMVRIALAGIDPNNTDDNSNQITEPTLFSDRRHLN